MTENPPPPPGTPEGGGSTPPPPQNPYGSQPPPPTDPYAGNPPAAGQTPYGSAPQEPPPPAPGQNPYGAASYPVSDQPPPIAGAQPAGLGSRFLARLIDGIMLGILQAIISLATGRVIAGVIGGIIYLGYYAYMESSQGHTFGKQWLKMRVLGPTGANPTMEEALRRNAWSALAILSSIPILGILTGLAELVAVIAIAVTINSDTLKRGWHDKFGNTSVIKEG